MVQLRPVKYEVSGRASAAAAAAEQRDQQDRREDQAQQEQEERRRDGSTRSSSRQSTLSGGANLTSGEESSLGAGGREQAASTLSSGEEMQSAVVDISASSSSLSAAAAAPEEGRQPSPKSGANLEQGKLEDIARQRALAAASRAEEERLVTRIEIKRGSVPELAEQSGRPAAAAPQQQQQQVRPLQGMPRAQTSPALGQLMAGANSPAPKKQGGGGGGHFQQHSSYWSPATSKRSLNQADNASQFSVNTQKNNQFEIRWHNVRLIARPRSSRLPRTIADSAIWRFLSKSDGEPEQTCYSPPMYHKSLALQKKTQTRVDETRELESGFGLEMRAAPLGAPNKADLQQQEAGLAPGERCILNNISGQVFSGQMTAILGPSGVGKTTLLNSLTGRNTLAGSGRVSLLRAPASSRRSKRMSVVTVPQVDVLPGKLSVREDLLFTSRLKNPEMGWAQHERNIARIVKHMHMDKFLNTRVQKLSGGEARRLSIARELLASPDIIILDEPTSGLDANTCKKIIIALRDIVEHSENILDKPMSIIVTIHQPQQEVYNLFHRIYVMALGGRVVYEGAPEPLMPTLLEFSSLGSTTKVEQLNENPAIVAIEVASGEYGNQVIEELSEHHEDQVYEEFSHLAPAGQFYGAADSPMQTPRSLQARRSPLSLARFAWSPASNRARQRRRLNSFGDSSLGRPTPVLAKRHWLQQQQQLGGGGGGGQLDTISSLTSLSHASTYDADLPEQPASSRLKVDKRLRRSVVMKSHLFSHTWTLIQRCWLLTTRDAFLMCIRIIGFLMVAGGTVQIFADSLDPNEHQCPRFESEVDNVLDYVGDMRQRLLGMIPMLRQASSSHMFFFHILLCITMVTSALGGLVFPMQMRMFIREYKNGWYSPASFIISQTLAELPVDIIGPLITMLIAYPLCHQPESSYY